MTNVRVRNGKSARETATLLLAAAEELGQDQAVVQTSSLGGFLVPEDVAAKAGLDHEDPIEADGSRFTEDQIKAAAKTEVLQPQPEIQSEPDPSVPPAPETEPVAKKAPAKKAAAKKTTTARKTAAKKTATKKAGN